MAIPFGFSAGDFMAAIHLVHKVSTALRETDGASSEYSQSILQLDSLEGLLRNIQTVYSTNVTGQQIDRLQILTHECYIPLNKFLSKIKILEPSLGNFVLGSNRITDKTKRAARKVQWGLQLRKELSNLMMAIGPRMEAINMQLLFIVIECQQKTGSSVDILSQTLNDLNAQMRNFQKSLDIRIDSLATITSMENVSQTLQDMKLEARAYQSLHIEAISKRIDVQPVYLDLETSQQVLGAIQSLTYKKEDDKTWLGTDADQIAASLDPESKPCSIDHSETACHDQGRMKKMEDQLAGQNQQLHLLIGMIGELQSSISRHEENPGFITQDVQEIIEHAIYVLLEFFRTAANDLLLKLWIVLPLAQHIFRILQAPRLLVSLTIGDSIVFEDVLGRVVHLPYIHFRHYTVFVERLRCEFEGKPGENEVLMNQFRIFRHGRYNEFFTQKNWSKSLRPGSRIAMSIVLNCPYGKRKQCPRCKAVEPCRGVDGLRQWYVPANVSEFMLILRSTNCGLSWALHKLNSPHKPSPKPAIQEVTSSLPLPTKMQNMKADEHFTPSKPLLDASVASLYSGDDKDIQKFRIVHVQKRDPHAYASLVASNLKRIGFSLYKSFPWSPIFTTVESKLMSLIQKGPSNKREIYQPIYIFRCEGTSEIVRIGRTQNVQTRFTQMNCDCGYVYKYNPKLYEGRKMHVPSAELVANLVYTELSDYRLRATCKRCPHIHRNLFFVSMDHAIKVVQKWKHWMFQDPYMQNSYGRWKLKPAIIGKVEKMCRPLGVEY